MPLLRTIKLTFCVCVCVCVCPSFLRHGSILQHPYGSRALRDGPPEGAALSVDLKSAFPIMSHEMVAAALGLMCIPCCTFD